MSEPRKIHVSGTFAATTAVTASYIAKHEYHAEMEQLLVSQGRYDEAQDHHHAAVRLAMALTRELDNLPPEGLGK